ncbi:hypothetical protein ABZX11_48150, partial [Amycolatopsis sp. NPDC004169]
MLQPYYAAAVHSMSCDVTALFFAGFDSVGVVTVDKPPLAFWTQALGVAVFGFHPWAIALAPAIAALAAAGLVTAASWSRFVLSAAVAGTAVLAYVLLGRTPDWLPWLRYTVAALALLAVVAALVRAARVAAVIGLVAVVAGPAAFVADTAVRPKSVLE